MLAGIGDEPDEHIWLRWVMQAVPGIGNGKRRFAATCGRSCGKETHGLFDYGCGIGELVEQERIFGNLRCSLGSVRSENFVVFGAYPREHIRVLGEKVKNVANGTAGSIVA